MVRHSKLALAALLAAATWNSTAWAQYFAPNGNRFQNYSPNQSPYKSNWGGNTFYGSSPHPKIVTDPAYGAQTYNNSNDNPKAQSVFGATAGRNQNDFLSKYLQPEVEWDTIVLPKELTENPKGEQFLRCSGFLRDDGVLRGRGKYNEGASVGFRWYSEGKDFVTVAFGNGQLTETGEPANGVGIVFDPPKEEIRVLAYAAGAPPTILETHRLVHGTSTVRQSMQVSAWKGTLRYSLGGQEGTTRPVEISIPSNHFATEFRPLLIRKSHVPLTEYVSAISRLIARPL